MNKKISLIICLMSILLFTGCSVEYNLEFKDGQVIEDLNIKEIKGNYKEDNFTPRYAIPSEKAIYSKSFSNGNLNYNYKYNFSNFYKSSILNNCYNAHSFINEDDGYLFQTGSEFKCLPYQEGDNVIYDYDKLTVKIKVDSEVIKSNADEVSNGVYKWYITKKNYKNKPISIKFKRKEKEEIIKPGKREEKKKDKSLYIFIGFFIIVGGIILVIINILKNKNNQL